MAEDKNVRNADEPAKTTPTSQAEFDEAVDRVYKRYGSDLAAFVRDVQKELQKRADPNKRAACGAAML